MAYNQEEIDKIFNSICFKIAEEGKALRNILKEDNMPSSQTFYNWLQEDIEKSKQYARATDIRAEAVFEEILEIADDQESDIYKDKDGVEQINYNVIQRAKLRVDSRKWILSKLNPKKYSDKIQIDNSEFREQPLFPE